MKIYVFTLILILISPLGFAAENYEMEINGHKYEIGLDKLKDITLPDGKGLKVKLKLKDYVTYESKLFSFAHKNKYKPNQSDLGDGVFQSMIVTPLGTGILIQEYTTSNPSALVDFMLQELIKEEVSYGYKLKKSDVFKMVGKIKLKGKQAITEYKDEKWTRAVYSYGKKDIGILIVIFIEQDNVAQDKHLVDDLWKSLKINL